MITLRENSLPQDAAQAYWDDGYLFPIETVGAQQAALWRSELEAAEKAWLDNGLPRPLMTYKRVNAHLVMPLAHEIGTHPAILDAVQGVMGPDIMLYSVEFMTKEAHSQHIVTMHQDLAYWGYGESDGILTAWLALSPATKQSGCMDFVKGSHKNQIIPHTDTFDEKNLLSRGQEIQVDVAEHDKVCGELAPGQISLHHGLMIHGSGPNVTDDRRIGAVLRYLSPHEKKPGGSKDYGFPARGNCDTGNYTLTPAPSGWFTDQDMALYEEVRAEQAKVMMAGAQGQAEMYT